MPKRLGDLPTTGQFLVDTLRPRRNHGVIEAYKPRRSGLLEGALVLLALGLVLAGLVYLSGR